MIWLPVVILGLAGVAHVATRRRQSGQLTAERLDMLEGALRSQQDPAKLREMAKVFEQVELPQCGELLRRRAAVIELPADAKKARSEAYRKTMASKKPQVMLGVAAAFARDGCLGAADSIRRQAAAVQALLDAEANAPKETPKEDVKVQGKAA